MEKPPDLGLDKRMAVLHNFDEIVRGCARIIVHQLVESVSHFPWRS